MQVTILFFETDRPTLIVQRCGKRFGITQKVKTPLVFSKRREHITQVEVEINRLLHSDPTFRKPF